MKQILMLVVVVVGMLIGTGSVKAMSPIGLPTSTLEKGQVDIAYDYTISTQNLGVQNFGIEIWPSLPYELSPESCAVKSEMSTYTLSYGVTNDFEIFGRLGRVDISITRQHTEEFFDDNGITWRSCSGNNKSQLDLDSSLFGIGAKVNLFTLYDNIKSQEKLVVGIVTQCTYMKVKGVGTTKIINSWSGGFSPLGEPEDYFEQVLSYLLPTTISTLELFEGKFIPGLTYINGHFSVYGGPIVYTFFTFDTTTILGYVGSSLKITDDLLIRGEYQFGDNYEAISGGLVWRF